MSISSITKTFGDYVYDFYLDSENPEFYYAISIRKLYDQNVGSLNIEGFNNIPVGHFDVSDNGSNFITLKLQPEKGPKYCCYTLAVVDGWIQAHEQVARSAYPNKTFARFSSLGHFREVDYLTCRLSGPQLTRIDVIATVQESLKSLPYNDMDITSTTVVKSMGNNRCTFVVGLLSMTGDGEIYFKIGVVDKHGILRWICEGTPWVSKHSYQQDKGVKEGSPDRIRVVYQEKIGIVSIVAEGKVNVNLKFDEFYSSMVLQNNTEEPTLLPALLSFESKSHPTITDKPQLEKQLEIKLKNNGVALDELLTARHTELTEEILQLQKKIEDHVLQLQKKIEDDEKLLKSMKTELQGIQTLQQTRSLNQSTST